MGIKARIRNGLRVDPATGLGGATEGDIRGSSADIVEQNGGVPNLTAGDLLVHQTSTATMAVVIDPGVGYIPNSDFDRFDSDSIKFWEVVVDDDAIQSLTLDDNPTGDTRVDLICLKMDVTVPSNSDGSNISSLVVVKGVPSAGAPSTPSNHLILATINVLSGTANIENEDITDSRAQITFKADLLPDQLSGKRIDKRVRSLVSTSTLTPNVDNEDLIFITAQAANLTVAAPAGTPTNGQTLILRMIDNGITRTITWNSIFREVGAYLPTDTEPGKLLYMGFIWNEVSSKWDVIMTIQE